MKFKLFILISILLLPIIVDAKPQFPNFTIIEDGASGDGSSPNLREDSDDNTTCYYNYKDILADYCLEPNERLQFNGYDVCFPKSSSSTINKSEMKCPEGYEVYKVPKLIKEGDDTNEIIGYGCRKKTCVNVNVGEENTECKAILGSPEDSAAPAFYLQTIFEIMKYVAIMLLVVMTILDFVGAITSHDNDALKKAMSKATMRLIICVLIFVLPSLIKFLLTLLEVYNPSTCGIS